MEVYIMKTNKILLDDVEKIYFSIPCTSVVSCEHCKNKLLCDLTAYLLKINKEILFSKMIKYVHIRQPICPRNKIITFSLIFAAPFI